MLLIIYKHRLHLSSRPLFLPEANTEQTHNTIPSIFLQISPSFSLLLVKIYFLFLGSVVSLSCAKVTLFSFVGSFIE
uniref:Uncharacterized protein n=1 Tax=Rhizophora mucronata TaxID=61149 RepID=A0A2P2LF91_RHIMU